MRGSFRAFMNGLIDYAGLFPPAKLDLDSAIRNYARYLSEKDAWMLNRFIIPAARLEELDRYVAELFTGGTGPMRLTLLSRDGLLGFDGVRSFTERHGGRVAIEVVEVLLPPAVDVEAGVVVFLRSLVEVLAGQGLDGLALYAELPEGGGLDLDRAAAGIAAFNREGSRSAGYHAGFKLRCGGTEVAAFPPVGRVVRAVAACRDRAVPLKCTAGLHRPLRHHDPEIGAMHHGFLNVFGAGILAHAHSLPAERLASCLADMDAADFAFGDDAFTWRDPETGQAHDVKPEAVAAARTALMTGFGSCSFDEPREDLRSLGLLE